MKIKAIFKVAIIVIAIFLIVSVGGIFYLTRGLGEGSETKLNGINLSALEDGTYQGTYNNGRWTNQLEITVKEHEIIDIKINEDVTFAMQGVSEELFQKVMQAQNTTVDAVSQATITSKAYLKSIENALNQ